MSLTPFYPLPHTIPTMYVNCLSTFLGQKLRAPMVLTLVSPLETTPHVLLLLSFYTSMSMRTYLLTPLYSPSKQRTALGPQ
jgi:hypothetical protein